MCLVLHANIRVCVCVSRTTMMTLFTNEEYADVRFVTVIHASPG